MEKIRLVLGDKPGFFLEGLCNLLASDARFDVVGVGDDVDQLVDLVEKQRPDVAVIDPALADNNELDLVTRVGRASPTSRVLVMSGRDDARYLRASVMAGARGYVSKRLSSERLCTAITMVREGRSHVDVTLTNDGLEARVPANGNGNGSVGNGNGANGSNGHNGNGANGNGGNGNGHGANGDGETTNDLSRREREVLAMIAGGFTNREVAERLGLSVKTVESYRSRAMRKIGANSRAQLVRYAVLAGLLEVA